MKRRLWSNNFCKLYQQWKCITESEFGISSISMRDVMITSISQGFDQKIRIFDWCLGLCSKSFRENTRKTPKGEDILPLPPSRILDRVKVGILSYVKLAVLRNLKLQKFLKTWNWRTLSFPHRISLAPFMFGSVHLTPLIQVSIFTKTAKLNLVLTGLQQLDSIFCTYFSSPEEQMYIK